MPQLTLTEMTGIARTPPRSSAPAAKQSSPTIAKAPVGNSVTQANSSKRHRTDDDTSSGSSLTLDSAVEMLMNQFNQTKTMINAINTKIDSVKLELEGKLENVSQEITSLKQECAAKFKLSDEVVRSLDSRVDKIHQSVESLQNRNELIFSGIPYMSGENLMTYFQAICRQLGYAENYTPSVDLRRVSSKPLKDGDSSLIVVEFSLRNARDDFYGSYLKNFNLTLDHLGLQSTRRIYVNENLSFPARKLKAMALRLKKDGKIATVFTKLGVVHVKKLSGGSSVAVHAEEDLREFL